DDEGRVIASGAGHEPFYVASIVSGIATFTGRQDIAANHGASQLRHLLLGWPENASVSCTGTRAFERGGYTVSRGRMSGRESLAVFDHGALGYLSI
ncbi:hypothetical protein ABTE35_18790, partial [Acinetobacter baumannii]